MLPINATTQSHRRFTILSSPNVSCTPSPLLFRAYDTQSTVIEEPVRAEYSFSIPWAKLFALVSQLEQKSEVRTHTTTKNDRHTGSRGVTLKIKEFLRWRQVSINPLQLQYRYQIREGNIPHGQKETEESKVKTTDTVCRVHGLTVVMRLGRYFGERPLPRERSTTRSPSTNGAITELELRSDRWNAWLRVGIVSRHRRPQV